MESESDWDTQSEAAPSPRHDVGHGLFIDYSKPASYKQGDSHGQLQQRQPTSTPRLPQRTSRHELTNHQTVYGVSSNQVEVGVAGELNVTYQHSDDDSASVATVVQYSGSRSGSSRKSRSQIKEEQHGQAPPYDFSNTYRPDSQNSARTSERREHVPGKDRKGNVYDPSPMHEETDEEAALAELRAGMARGKQLEQQVRQQQQLETQRKQMELKSELEDLAREDLGTKEKVMARISSIADRLKSKASEPSPPDSKGGETQSKHIEEPHEVVKTAKSFVVREKNGDVIILPFEEVEREFYRTTEVKNSATMRNYADRSEKAMKRVWQELFAFLRMPFSIVLALLIEITHFILHDIFYKLILGMIALFGDFVIKASLTTLFNGFVQPILIFVWNVLIGVRHASEPIISLVRGFSQQVALMLRAFRLVEVHYQGPSYCSANNEGSNYSYSEEQYNA